MTPTGGTTGGNGDGTRLPRLNAKAAPSPRQRRRRAPPPRSLAASLAILAALAERSTAFAPPPTAALRADGAVSPRDLPSLVRAGGRIARGIPLIPVHSSSGGERRRRIVAVEMSNESLSSTVGDEFQGVNESHLTIASSSPDNLFPEEAIMGLVANDDDLDFEVEISVRSSNGTGIENEPEKAKLENATTAAVSSLPAVAIFSGITLSSSGEVSVDVDKARSMLEVEREGGMASAEQHDGDGEIPFAPMMTYQKFLTMQEKRVKVAIRYSASSGLRPFFLTVANRIKTTHPDVLLEKCILPPAGSDAGGNDAIFEVVVDGKVVLGKKKIKRLKVSSRSDGEAGVAGDGKEDDDKGGSDGSFNQPDIAGGRSVFVSMEKLDYELSKARRRRRPDTAYERRSDVLLREVAAAAEGGIVDGRSASLAGADTAEGTKMGPPTMRTVAVKSQPVGMTEAVLRLERLKALSSRKAVE